ncbi:lyase family protein [Salana multivorans]
MTESVREWFSAAAKRRRYVEVEVALAQAQAYLGIIPVEAAEAIAETARGYEPPAELVAERMSAHGHPMMALVEVFADAVGEHGGWVHWGATTQNIQQTGDVLILRDVHAVVVDRLRTALDRLADVADETADLPMAGRTHWQHAVPITFGYKVAVWINQLLRHLERLEQLAPRLLRSMTGGAAGTFASFGAEGPALQAEVARLLGLEPMDVPSRAIVDHLAELVLALGLLAATLQSIAEEVQRLHTPEYGEAREVLPPGQVGSSTMPQKRIAPHLAPMVIAAAQVRAAVPLALETVIQSHEVDGARSAILDRALEQASTCAVEAVENLVGLSRDLEVVPDRMLANLQLTGGLINAERVMLRLGDALGRQEAHHVVHRAVEAVNAGGVTFAEALTADDDVARVLTPDEVAELLDPTRYTGLSAQLAHETAARARAAAASRP